MEKCDRAAILAGTEKAVLEEFGRKEMGKVAHECGIFFYDVIVMFSGGTGDI